MNEKKLSPICMTKEFWANSPLSIVRHYGGIKAFGHEYIIVNSKGITIFDVSIPPGQPADLCRKDFIPFYKELGRDAFLQVLKDHPRTNEKVLKAIYKELTTKKKKSNEQGTISF